MAAGVIVLGGARPALAQQSPVARADTAGMLGWLAVNREPPGGFDYGNDWQHSLFAGATAGWYWTEHLKTELDFGAATRASAYRSRQVVIDGRPAAEFTESSYARRSLGLTQHYQFFRNAWFHPYIGAGVHFAFEESTDRTNPIVIYDGAPGPRVIRPERVDGPRSNTKFSTLATAGFKAYFTQRGFFRSDLRVTLRNGVDDALVRFGFGVDF